MEDAAQWASLRQIHKIGPAGKSRRALELKASNDPLEMTEGHPPRVIYGGPRSLVERPS
jgi:hypothetical protein